MNNRLSLFSMLAIGLLMGCNEEKEEIPLTVNPNSIVLYAESTEQITTNTTEGVTYVSEDKYYAEVDNTGLVTANKVGKTSIKVTAPNGMATIPVTILPAYSLYPDLDAIIGKAESDVYKLLGSNYEKSSSNGKIEIIYRNYNSYTEGILVMLNNGFVESVGAVVSTKYTTQITKSLIERYQAYAMQNDIYYFTNHDENVLIALTVASISQLMIVYAPKEVSKSADAIDISEELFMAFKHF